MTLGNQIFLRFYLVIVLSVVIVGWTVDIIWQSFEPLPEERYHEEILSLAAEYIESQTDSSVEQSLSNINQLTSQHLSLVSASQIQADELQQALLNNEIVTLENSDGSFVAYRQLGHRNVLLAIEIPMTEKNKYTKYLLLVTFYLLIAGVVYLWTRPLARDLKTLEDASQDFAHANWNTSVVVPSSSPVNHLAQAYNRLLVRIKQLLKDQQEMSHAISHELRTPLARIKFSLEMALNSDNLESVQKQLTSIDEDIVEIQTLVDELLSYASLEKSSTVANCESGDIKSLITTLAGKLRRNSPNKNLTVKINENTKLVYCDSYLIERALQNLIINAFSHCQSQVNVRFSQSDHVNQLVVEDDGHGIDPDDRARVFDSFVRLQPKQAKGRKGFGLGLAIVKRIATLHQGSVDVAQSTLGGASFIFEWPNQQ